jgi:anaerobic magnesium-protoporphyrin IX monomethyl ester cyclase
VKSVLFVYPGYIVREQPLNVLYVAGAVKAAGHRTAFFDVTPYRKRPLRGDPFRVMNAAFARTLDEFKPDVIGYSVMSVNYRITAELAATARARRPGALNVFGGIHPTVAPQETIADPLVDVLCRAEGEAAMTELLAALDSGSDYSGIAGLWVRKGGEVVRNPVRPLLQDLDPLPFPDRDLLAPERLQAELYGINMLTSRGCPFPCSYCQNEYLMDMARGQGSFVRYRSIDNVFAEIDEVIARYRPSRLSFSDESFTLNRKRLAEFCERYAERYSIPFLCQTRPDLIDEEVLRILKAGRCDFINMAIEAGNPRIRNHVLQRNIPTETIVESFTLARRFGIRTGSFNMIGLPGEDMTTVWDTINLNKRLQPDRIMCTVYMPFQGTRLGEECLEAGWLDHPIDDAEIYYTNIAIQHPTIPARRLFGYQGFFDYYVRLSPRLYGLIHFFRGLYQLMPPTSFHLPPLVRAVRESLINFVYNMKRFLPSRGFFMKTR